MVYRLTVFDS